MKDVAESWIICYSDTIVLRSFKLRDDLSPIVAFADRCCMTTDETTKFGE